MSSSRRAQDTSQQTPAAGLKVTLPVLVTASVLFLAALVLAYLGGVMTGRAQWASSLEESRAALAAAAATDGEKEESAAAGEAQTAADAGNTEDALVEASELAAPCPACRARRASGACFAAVAGCPGPQTGSGRGPRLSAHASGHAACRARGGKGAAANAHRHI